MGILICSGATSTEIKRVLKINVDISSFPKQIEIMKHPQLSPWFSLHGLCLLESQQIN